MALGRCRAWLAGAGQRLDRWPAGCRCRGHRRRAVKYSKQRAAHPAHGAIRGLRRDMTRQLQNTSQSVQTQIDAARSERTRRAYLVYPYRDGQLTTTVTFTDPRYGTMGATVQARISAGFIG